MRRGFMTAGLLVLLIGVGFSEVVGAAAQYPVKPIEFIVAVEAGADGDQINRPVVKNLSEILGQPVIIVNKPGGGSTYGYRELLNAKPDGYTIGWGSAVAVGIISGHVQGVSLGGRRLPEMVQADVDLYPGNSGGPLVDARGRVIGINSMVVGPRLALAVPSHAAQELVAASAPSRAFLGVSAQPVELPESLARGLGLAVDRGLLISAVVDGGPADRAGVLLGDVLVALDGRPTRGVEDLWAALGADRIGAQAPLRLIRGGEMRELVVTVGERA